MTKKSNSYGIADVDLLCDEKSDVCFPQGPDVLLEDYESAKPFIDDEERRITRQLELFVMTRLDARNTALMETSARLNEKIADFSYENYLTRDSLSATKRKFPKFIDYLETLSREDSGTRIESNENMDLVSVADGSLSALKVQENRKSMSVVPLDFKKEDGSSFSFSPANFSTPKDSRSTTSSMPSVVTQTPVVPRKSGHAALTRTDTSAICLPSASVPKTRETSDFNCGSVPSVTESIQNFTFKLQPSKICEQSSNLTFGVSQPKSATPLTFLKAESSIGIEHHTEELEAPKKNSKGLLPATSSASTAIENAKKFEQRQNETSILTSRQLWVERLPFDDFSKIERTIEADVTEFDKRSKIILHNLAKRSVKEKIACWTRKNATSEVIKLAVDYFHDLLTGKTVYGFDGKMLNFDGDEPGKKFSMSAIVNAYVSVVQKDDLLLECAATVLLSLMIKISGFKSVLYSKLFSASPLLSIDHKECLKQISAIRSDSGNASEEVNSWCTSQSAVIRLFVLLHCPTIKKAAVISGAEFDYTSKLWSFLAAAVSEDSPFSSALAAEILKTVGVYLRKVYGMQFRKLLTFLSNKSLKMWNDSLETDGSISGLSRMAIGYYLSVLNLALKDCSFE